jgi:nicotinate-nucleotide adenylyltransferase
VIVQRLGIFGGAFDPVHEGHIHIARLAREALDLERVYFLPLGQAVHKNQPHYSAAKRVELIRQAIAPYDYLDICLYDIERDAPSYAADTLENLQKLPDFTGRDLYYIIGIDAFERIFDWKNPRRLLQLVKFIVAARPGYDFSGIERRFALEESFLDRIFLLENSGVDMSSTRIRKAGGQWQKT